MNKKIIFSFLLLIVFISGCLGQEQITQEQITGNVVRETNEEFFCKEPYIEYQKGSCCLDKNNNGVCDYDDLKFKSLESNDEVVEEEIKVIEEKEETCPYTCPGESKCMPVYKDGSIDRWACT